MTRRKEFTPNITRIGFVLAILSLAVVLMLASTGQSEVPILTALIGQHQTVTHTPAWSGPSTDGNTHTQGENSSAAFTALRTDQRPLTKARDAVVRIRSSGIQGSGFIYDKAGYIITAGHVVKNAEVVKVSILNGQEISGKVVGRNEPFDLATIKVDLSGPAPVAQFGDSTRLSIGDKILAVGYALGTSLPGSATVTSGNRFSAQSGR